MPKSNNSQRRSNCPISISLELFGDRWTLLIVRDLLFQDLHTFKEFLDQGEGIASNILADRLKRLEQRGIIKKFAHLTDARKARYELTEKGYDLAPVLIDPTAAGIDRGLLISKI